MNGSRRGKIKYLGYIFPKNNSDNEHTEEMIKRARNVRALNN